MKTKTASILVALALAAGISSAVAQTLIWSDYFDDTNSPGWIGMIGPGVVGTDAISNGQCIISGSFSPTPPGGTTETYICGLHSIPTSGPLPDQQTLEARVDLVAGSRNGAHVHLQLVWYEGVSTHAYSLWKDLDEIGLVKAWNGGRALAFFFATNQPLKNTNVTLVLALKRVGSNLQIRSCVLDKDNGNAVLFDRTVTDTPQSDPVAPNTSGLATVPDLAGMPWPIASAPGSVELGLDWVDTNSASGPIEIALDNLEVWQYAMPQLTIQNAVVLSWPLPQGKGQFAIESAENVNGPWEIAADPWCRTKDGRVEASIPAPSSRRFFRLRFEP